jgi:hypothetical protein
MLPAGAAEGEEESGSCTVGFNAPGIHFTTVGLPDWQET